MWKVFPLLAAALVVTGQPAPPDNTIPGGPAPPAPPRTTLDIANKNAPSGDGSYASMMLHGTAAGEVPHYAEITLFPPQRWGRVTCMVEDTSVATPNRNQNCDHVVVDLVGVSTFPPSAPNDYKNWVPWNQYPRATWENMVWRFAGFDSGMLYSETAQITSSPPCLFTAVVAKGGASMKLMVQDCALVRQSNVANNAPGTGSGIYWQSVFDKLVIFVPWSFLAASPVFPHSIIDTQATFFLADEGTNGQNPPPAFTAVGPFRVNTPYFLHSTPLQMMSLQFLDFLPGVPAQNIKPNTKAGTALEGMTITMYLGHQLSAGMKVAISVSVGPVDVSGTGPFAPPQAFPTAASGQQGLIWATPTSVPENTFIPLGPGCARSASSVNCCSQSVGQILVPQVSVMSYPEWFVTLSITLGPVGCVLPGNRRVQFVIPKAYLGKNPSQTVTNAAANEMPGFWAVQAVLYTTVEPGMHFFRRHGGDISPLAYQQGYWGTVDRTQPQPLELLYNQEMPEQLPDAVRMPEHSLAYGGVLSSYVVGTGTFRSVTFAVDTTTVMQQPRKVDVTITLDKGLVRLLDGAGQLITRATPYVITIFLTSGVIRQNIATVVNPIPLQVSAPGNCADAFTAMTTATGNMLISFSNDRCISSLTADGSVIQFTIPEQFLHFNFLVGVSVTADVRLVPPMHSVAATAVVGPLGGAKFGPLVQGGGRPLGVLPVAAGLDTAMLMGIPAWVITADCATMPSNFGAVNDVQTMTPASRCALVESIVRISFSPVGFLQCNPGATVQNAQNLRTFLKYPEAMPNGALYPATALPPPASSWPQNVGLGGTPPVWLVSLGFMYSDPMVAVIISYPPSAQSLKAVGASPSVPATYTLAFLIRIARATTACSVVTETNPWQFCVGVPSPVVNPLWFPAANPVPAGTLVHTGTYGRSNAWKSNVACFIIEGDGAVAAWYPIGASPTEDDSDGAWYAFFAFFALPLLLLCCCLAALLYFLKMRKPKTCCPAEPQCAVQETYWVNTVVAPGCYAPAGSPFYAA